MIRAPMITLTGVLALDALSLYRTEKRSSSIAGKSHQQRFLPMIFPELFSHVRLLNFQGLVVGILTPAS